MGRAEARPYRHLGRGVFHPRPHLDPLRVWTKRGDRGKSQRKVLPAFPLGDSTHPAEEVGVVRKPAPTASW